MKEGILISLFSGEGHKYWLTYIKNLSIAAKTTEIISSQLVERGKRYSRKQTTWQKSKEGKIENTK